MVIHCETRFLKLQQKNRKHWDMKARLKSFNRFKLHMPNEDELVDWGNYKYK